MHAGSHAPWYLISSLIERLLAVLLGHGTLLQRVTALTAAARLSAPAAANARHGGGGNVGQAAAKVGAYVVIDERIGARVAVGETVAEDAEYGVAAGLRQQSEVGDEQVRVHRKPADAEHDDDGQEHPPRVRRTPTLQALQPGATGSRSAGGLDRHSVPPGDQIAHDQQVHGDDDGQRNDVGEREEGDEERRTVAQMVVQGAVVVRLDVRVRHHEHLDAVHGQQRRVGGHHCRPDGDHHEPDPPRRRRRQRRRPYDGHEADDGDGDQRVDGDVDADVEDEVRQFAGDVADLPVVGGEVVRDERHGHDEEQKIAGGQIQQQQIDGGPHRAARQRHVDDEGVADHADSDDQSKHHRHDHLVQDDVKQQLVL